MIYFIRAGRGPIKIGFTKSMRTRFLSLQSGCPDELLLMGTLTGGFSLEQSLHVKFASARVNGEWFSPTEELLSYISSNARSPSPDTQEADKVPERLNSALPVVGRTLEDLGIQIRNARVRRKISAARLAERAGMSRPTLRSIERGDGGSSLGSVARVLDSLGLLADLKLVAKDDILGRKLQDAGLPQRVSRRRE